MTPFERLLPGGASRRISAVAVGLVLCCLMPSMAMGQSSGQQSSAESGGGSGADSEDAEARMMDANEAGFSAFAEGEFVEAAEKFEEAHTYVPDPILRKNAAIAWFKAGRCEEASEAAIFFLIADEMTVRDRVEARSVLGHCRLERAEEAIEKGQIERAETIAHRVSFLKTDERVEERLAALRMQLVEAGAGAKADAWSNPRKATGWLLVAGGAAILAGNVGYHIMSHKNPGTDDTADWLVPTLYGVGGVSVGSGLYLAVSADSGEPANAQKPAAQKAPAPAMQLNLSLKF